jgi:hypothetical protein
MWTNFPLFGGYDNRSDIDFNSEDLINLFMIADPQGKKKFAYLGTPGLLLALTVQTGNAPARALYTYEDSMYGIFGADVYRFTAPLVKNHIGTIGSTQGFVSITANNAGQVIFTDGQKGYIYNVNTGVFALIDTTVTASSGFPGAPTNVVVLDSFFVVPDAASRTYQISAINDGTKWDPLDEGQIQAYPGENVGVGVVNRRLYFFKTDSTEVWYDAGAADFPFRRDNNLLFNFGCLAASSIVSDFGYLFWLARDRSGVGSVMMTTGQEPTKISDESIDNLIAGFVAPADVISYLYKDLGHIFLVMTWNTDDTTLVYDQTMKIWHQMQMHKTTFNRAIPNSGKVRHLSNCHAYFNNTHYIGSYKDPTLYEFSRKFGTNNGEEIRRIRICPHFFDENYRMIQVTSLQIDMKMGIGLSGGDEGVSDWITNNNDFVITNTGDNLVWANARSDVGINPKVYIRISRDGGNTYGNYHAASIGRIGERRARALFRRLGLARDFVVEISFYDPVKPVAILGASIRYEVLNK